MKSCYVKGDIFYMVRMCGCFRLVPKPGARWKKIQKLDSMLCEYKDPELSKKLVVEMKNPKSSSHGQERITLQFQERHETTSKIKYFQYVDVDGTYFKPAEGVDPEYLLYDTVSKRQCGERSKFGLSSIV